MGRLLDSWDLEDFAPPPARAPEFFDFWEPHSTDPTEASQLLAASKIGIEANSPQDADTNHYPPLERNADRQVWFDYWDPLPEARRASLSSVQTASWYDEVVIPAFDPAGHEPPFVLDLPLSSRESVALKCSAAILALAGLIGKAQDRLIGRFVDLFTDYPHPSTYLAIATLIREEDASPDQVLATYDFKKAWNDNPNYSAIRQKRGNLSLIENRDGLMYWRLAFRLVVQTRGTPPETIIDASWIDEWLDLPSGDPLRFRFIDYVCARLQAFEEGALDEPPTRRRPINRLEDPPAGRMYPRFQYGRESLKDIATIDGYQISNNGSRTALLMNTYTNPLGNYSSAINKANTKNTETAEEMDV
ncbi:hypothetical protein [Rhodopseudomonas pseudopalustris]|uniref:Uncharacterized protein n=1 Tax=Rhodopseudomonas pseudopalustris TaxID=1513892 RepID=A0A1H8NRV2_9BRAD|nr:hypothetical protein [Rhodopseudomonas pseudopalustris]SEO32322.1 hypothetical protein SAMN05444123_102242 [Rhodopseudomonas pseudopalustris]